jgi:hypothetical protein
LLGAGVDSTVYNIVVMGFSGGTFAECITTDLLVVESLEVLVYVDVSTFLAVSCVLCDQSVGSLLTIYTHILYL